MVLVALKRVVGTRIANSKTCSVCEGELGGVEIQSEFLAVGAERKAIGAGNQLGKLCN